MFGNEDCRFQPLPGEYAIERDRESREAAEERAEEIREAMAHRQMTTSERMFRGAEAIMDALTGTLEREGAK